MIHEDVPMDTIIKEIMFQDGKDDTVGVVRFDIMVAVNIH
jgi:hypothetical protein